MSIEYEKEQERKLHEKELIESETRRLLREQEKAREKARLKTQGEHDEMIRLEVQARQRRELNKEQLVKKYERERQAKYERDIEMGVNTPAELKERDRLYLEALKDGKESAKYRWSASPQKRPFGVRKRVM